MIGFWMQLTPEWRVILDILFSYYPSIQNLFNSIPPFLDIGGHTDLNVFSKGFALSAINTIERR